MSTNGKNGNSAATIGRPTVCTPELVDRMANEVVAVGTIETAVRAMPYTLSTHYLWMAKGRAGESPYSDYSDAVLTAREEFIATNVIEPAVALANGAEETYFQPGKDEPVTVKRAPDPRWTFKLAEVIDPARFCVRSKAFEFRAMLETMQAVGIPVSQEGAIKLASHVLGIDASELKIRGNTLDTGDKRRNIIMAALDKLEDAEGE